MDVNFQFDWSAAFSSIPYLLPGIPWTLLISFGGLAIGFFIGIFFGLLLKQIKLAPVRPKSPLHELKLITSPNR